MKNYSSPYKEIIMEDDKRFMQRCIQLARCGEAGAAPNPMVGAVVVCDGRIIGEGFHRRCGGPHAEVNAIASVRDKQLLGRSTLYVSLEPCTHFGKTPPCTDLIIRSGIPKVVIGCTDTTLPMKGDGEAGIKKLREAGCEVVAGVLEKECRELNRRFFTFHEKHRPWILFKWAQSEDGYMGRTEGRGVPFSTRLTQTLVHRLRARYQAIMVGTNTAMQDNPSLTTRYWHGPTPLRITIDRHKRLPDTLHLKDGSTPTVIYTHESLQEIMADLYSRGIQSLIVEGGARLLQSFIDEGLWDEARIETAPVRLGNGVAAPSLTEQQLQSQQSYDGHIIQSFRHKPQNVK